MKLENNTIKNTKIWFAQENYISGLDQFKQAVQNWLNSIYESELSFYFSLNSRQINFLLTANGYDGEKKIKIDNGNYETYTLKTNTVDEVINIINNKLEQF